MERGDSLMDGNPVPHDMLKVMGVEVLAEYLINEIRMSTGSKAFMMINTLRLLCVKCFKR